MRLDDYLTSVSIHTQTGQETHIQIPKSNVLVYSTEDGTRIAARPSGTEPKIKFYMSVNTTLENELDFERVNDDLDAKLERIVRELNLG